MRCAALALLTAAAGCERAPRAAPRADDGGREAARDACIAAELVARGEENVAVLQSVTPAEAAELPGPAAAAYAFSRAYLHHAELRAGSFAYLDSAANHARSPADSTRFAHAAARFVPRLPEPGSLEESIQAVYVQDFARILADEDHRCHWDL